MQSAAVSALVLAILNVHPIAGHLEQNVSKWMGHHEQEFQKLIQRHLFDETRQHNVTIHHGKPSQPNYFHVFSEPDVNSNIVEPDEASAEGLRVSILELFSKPRHFSKWQDYRATRSKLKQKFESHGLETKLQSFKAEIKTDWFPYSVDGMNIIGILPGKHRGTSRDKIAVFGAHYDTVSVAPGVDDNGSGAAAVLEAVRLLSPFKGQLDATIIFVLFDLEEYGLHGSITFTSKYLVPTELMKNKATFLGAFVIDMALLYEEGDNTQTLPSDIRSFFRDEQRWLERNGNKGDFIGVWSRKGVDTFLYEKFRDQWNKSDKFPKILALEPTLPASQPDASRKQMFATFFRSDHAAFWYHKVSAYKFTLPAILISDWGPWRGYQVKCYHEACDDTSQLTEKNLSFLKKTVDTLVRVLLSIAEPS